MVPTCWPLMGRVILVHTGDRLAPTINMDNATVNKPFALGQDLKVYYLI